MIIPSIDLQQGQTVQLIGGKQKALDAGDPRPIAKQFSLVGEIAVIDLDAAMGEGSNADLIEAILPSAKCRVGGGIRSVEQAIHWLDKGAAKVILGTAAKEEILQQLPRERSIAALDCVNGEIYTHGWRQATGVNVIDRIRELRPYIGGFLITFIEREGRMGGVNFERVAEIKKAAGDAELTIAGGVSTIEEIAELDRMEVDAQVGMALYTGAFDLADTLAAILRSDRPDGLWPTVVTNEHGAALGLTYSNRDSLRLALTERKGIYYSRSRGLWRKGETSGNGQELLHVDLDCDRDTLRFIVRQHGNGFCHKGTDTCWGTLSGIAALESRIDERISYPIANSYTNRLLQSPEMLASKLLEEAGEFIEAENKEHATQEAADLLYFLSVGLSQHGIEFSDVERVLDQRAMKVTRRLGNVKTV